MSKRIRQRVVIVIDADPGDLQHAIHEAAMTATSRSMLLPGNMGCETRKFTYEVMWTGLRSLENITPPATMKWKKPK